MSKFNNPARALGGPPPPLAMTPLAVHDIPNPLAPVQPAAVLNPASDTSVMTAFGFAALCALLLSGYLNDWSIRLLGGKAYLSTLCILLVPAIWLIGGNALSGFRDRMGAWWVLFVVLMVAGVPFSYYRSQSLIQIWTYVFRSLGYFFYVVSFATTLRRCRNVMVVNVIVAIVVVFTCVTFGDAGSNLDTRFRVADSLFLSNSNELALQLLLGITALMFLFYMGGIGKGAIAAAGIFGSFAYILRTGSRGCLVSAIALFIVVFWISKRKIQLLAFGVPVLAMGLLVVPSASMHRFTFIFQPGPAQPLNLNDQAAAESMTEREELLKKGVEYTVTHPVFGVGMGQFAVAYTGDAEKEGKHAPWLGTHNSYTQVSAECGIPAFICYMAIIILTFRRTYGVYTRAVGRPRLREIEGLAFCLFAGILVYSIATFFFHMAYTAVLPLLSGQAVALGRCAQPYLANAESVQTASRSKLNPTPAVVVA